jgi:ABC-type glycerol-3-phosphate transport system permease component
LATIEELRDPAWLPILWRTVCTERRDHAGLSGAGAADGFSNGPRRAAPCGSGCCCSSSFPFLSNFLIRIFAWKSLLHPEGPLTKLLVWLHVVPEDALLLNNVGAVLLVLIYTQLPFAILPLYAAAEKFDFGLLDAARDLGAGPWRSFSKVFRSRRAARQSFRRRSWCLSARSASTSFPRWWAAPRTRCSAARSPSGCFPTAICRTPARSPPDFDACGACADAGGCRLAAVWPKGGGMKRSWLPACITLGVVLFLFAPLVVLIANSFNASRFGGEWEGFTWNWYEKLWAAGEVWESLWITLKIALSASLAAMVLGTLAAYSLHRFRSWLQNVHSHAHHPAAGHAGHSHGHLAAGPVCSQRC